MRVISPPIKGWTRKFKCLGCQVRLEADAEDLRFMDGDRSGEAGSYYVECSLCHTREWLSPAVVVRIPPRVLAAVHSKPG